MARFCPHRRSNGPRNAPARARTPRLRGHPKDAARVPLRVRQVASRGRPTRSPASGFTLVEVLVALAILAIALAAVLRAMGQAINLTSDLRDRTEALWVAEDRVTEHQLARDWPALDTKEGTLEFDGHQWHWRESVTAFLNFDDLRKLDVDVTKANSPDVLAHLSVFLRRPNP